MPRAATGDVGPRSSGVPGVQGSQDLRGQGGCYFQIDLLFLLLSRKQLGFEGERRALAAQSAESRELSAAIELSFSPNAAA